MNILHYGWRAHFVGTGWLRTEAGWDLQVSPSTWFVSDLSVVGAFQLSLTGDTRTRILCALSYMSIHVLLPFSRFLVYVFPVLFTPGPWQSARHLLPPRNLYISLSQATSISIHKVEGLVYCSKLCLLRRGPLHYFRATPVLAWSMAAL